MSESKLPKREQILRRMWRLANAKSADAVRLACFPDEVREGWKGLDLDALTEFKRGANGGIEMKFTDRVRILERLLEVTEQGGEEQLDRFLRAMESGEGSEEEGEVL